MPIDVLAHMTTDPHVLDTPIEVTAAQEASPVVIVSQ